jgi:rhamnose utilization protein RhaD (predicted bifunctional aldolase and dehydrogenase)/NAD(P)-dependent dehydrogenase (short-subunit alcohol dehydrogenase family)
MESRYLDQDAARVVEEYRGIPEALALRTYTARLLGADPALVLHGGGNTSVKAHAKDRFGQEIESIHVKGSGWDLATIEPPGHPAVRLEPLRKLRELPSLSDEDMVNELRTNLLDASAPTPSVETLLHAFIPARYIDHTHADAVLAIADQPSAEQVIKDAFRGEAAFIPYVMPGFELAKRCADAYRPGLQVMILEKHGIFTFGETAKEAYERMIAAVTRAERYVGDKRGTVSVALPVRRTKLEQLVLPRLRGALAKLMGEEPERGPILLTRSTEQVLAFLERKDAFDLSQTGCATPDHVIRTKPTALFVRAPSYDDPAKLTIQLENEITLFARRYDAYFEEMCAAKKVSRKKLDPWPRIILLPGFGLVSVGKTQKEASVAAEIYEHTIDVMEAAAGIGTYAPVSRSDLFDLEYWSLEQAKIKKVPEPALFGRVALVTGAASGIGRATAEAFVRLGASVVLVDKDPVQIPGATLSVAANVIVTSHAREAVERAVSAFGGLDIVVSNAGNAPEGRLDTESGESALERSLELNLMAHNHVARAAAEVMLAQGRGGCLLFNASKSAFNPGPNFGPYAVAKAGLVALMRQYAVDLGQYGVRANAVNADRIRTALFGAGVVESRAAARGVSVEEYFRANLLHREVTADDVADAFVYLAGALSTTGCVLTVDGGNAAAFPR